jgi:hypothetical protein
VQGGNFNRAIRCRGRHSLIVSFQPILRKG